MIIAMSLHFLFLSAFAWMFMEGYQIYVMLVKVLISYPILIQNDIHTVPVHLLKI
jgi:hypothetical protein